MKEQLLVYVSELGFGNVYVHQEDPLTDEDIEGIRKSLREHRTGGKDVCVINIIPIQEENEDE